MNDTRTTASLEHPWPLDHEKDAMLWRNCEIQCSGRNKTGHRCLNRLHLGQWLTVGGSTPVVYCWTHSRQARR